MPLLRHQETSRSPISVSVTETSKGVPRYPRTGSVLTAIYPGISDRVGRSSDHQIFRAEIVIVTELDFARRTAPEPNCCSVRRSRPSPGGVARHRWQFGPSTSEDVSFQSPPLPSTSSSACCTSAVIGTDGDPFRIREAIRKCASHHRSTKGESLYPTRPGTATWPLTGKTVLHSSPPDRCQQSGAPTHQVDGEFSSCHLGAFELEFVPSTDGLPNFR